MLFSGNQVKCYNPACKDDATVRVLKLDGTKEKTCDRCIPRDAIEVTPLKEVTT